MFFVIFVSMCYVHIYSLSCMCCVLICVDKKLSCRKEAARCFVSLKILVSLKVTHSDSHLHC